MKIQVQALQKKMGDEILENQKTLDIINEENNELKSKIMKLVNDAKGIFV